MNTSRRPSAHPPRSAQPAAQARTRCHRSNSTWQGSGDLKAKSHATWTVSLACVCAAVACRDCAAQPQRRRKNSDEPAGQRALASPADTPRGVGWEEVRSELVAPVGAMERRAGWEGGS